MRTLEQRFNPTQVRAARSQSAGSPGTITGYASTFNSLSADLGGFRERVAPGAFASSLRKKPDVKALVNHDPSMILGRTKNGTLSLAEDSVGLRFSCVLPDTSVGRDLLESVNRGDISECSFAFTPDEDEWVEEGDPETNSRIAVRTLRAVSIQDISCVTYPAYAATSVSSADPAAQVLGRSYFPEGVPMEVRSHVPALRNLKPQESRRRLFNLIVG